MRGRQGIPLARATMWAILALAAIDSPLLAASRWFKSAQGGYQVGIPKEWHVKEVADDRSYQAALSREKVEKEGDLYQFGVSILRLRDWRSAFKFTSTDPDAMSLEFANRLAGHDEGEGQSLVIALPGPLRGRPSSLFHIVKRGGTDACLDMWLVTAPQGAEWFHALWEIPCKESDAHESEINIMVQDLTVFPKWGSR